MENFIKEAKVNFDAYHLPCLSFKANHRIFTSASNGGEYSEMGILDYKT